jgi:hypothetical protein
MHRRYAALLPIPFSRFKLMAQRASALKINLFGADIMPRMFLTQWPLYSPGKTAPAGQPASSRARSLV